MATNWLEVGCKSNCNLVHFVQVNCVLVGIDQRNCSLFVVSTMYWLQVSQLVRLLYAKQAHSGKVMSWPKRIDTNTGSISTAHVPSAWTRWPHLRRKTSWNVRSLAQSSLMKFPLDERDVAGGSPLEPRTLVLMKTLMSSARPLRTAVCTELSPSSCGSPSSSSCRDRFGTKRRKRLAPETVVPSQKVRLKIW